MTKPRCKDCIYRWTGLCPRGERGTVGDYLACKFFIERRGERPDDA